MAKTIGVLLSLKDQFTTPLQNATKSVKTMDRELKKAGNSIKAFGRKIKDGMKSVAKWAAIGFGALTAAAGVFIKQSIDGAKQKLKADKLLETNLMKQVNASKEHIKMLKDEASALQDIGVVGDDVAVAGASRLAVFKMNADQIKKTMPILDDMIAYDKGLNGTQEDAIAIGELYGKAINGKVNALKKYGVVLTANEEKLFKVMSTEQRIEFINKKLEKSIGGTNKALRATDEGKIVAMKGAWGDMQAELGKKLMPKLGAIAEWFHSKIPAIQDFILSLADKVEELVTRAEPYITQIKNMFGKIFEKVKPALEETWNLLKKAGKIAIDIAQGIIDNWDIIGPLFQGVAIAFGVLAGAVTVATTATAIFNAVMSVNPVMLVVMGIGLLIGGIILFYKKWDKISKWMSNRWDEIKKGIKAFCDILKNIFLKVWDVVVGAWNYAKEVISGVCDVLVGIFMPIWEAVCDGINWLKDIVLGVCDVVGGIFTAIWDGVVKALDKLKEGFNKVTDFITGAFMSAWDSLMKALDAILHPIETAKKAFGGLIDKLKFWNKTPADDKTINITENTKKTTETVGGANKTGVATTSIKNPRHALGTAYFKGGVTKINEGGRDETAILPAGTQILSHEEGKSLQKNNTEKQVIIKEVESKKSSDKKVEVHIHIGGNFIGEKEHMEKYGEYTANKILAALNNM